MFVVLLIVFVSGIAGVMFIVSLIVFGVSGIAGVMFIVSLIVLVCQVLQVLCS